MGFLTPNTAPAAVQCRALFIPDDDAYLAVLRGLLQELTFPSSWTKFGALTPDEAAEACVDMFNRFCLEKDTCRMIGEFVPYAGDVSPRDTWLVCDGREVALADYPDLYVVIGDKYGAASVGYFRLPDLQGRSPAGAGTGAGLSPVTVGQKYGEQSHVLTVTEMPAHAHSVHAHGVGLAVTPGELPVTVPSLLPDGTGSTGGDGSHNTIGPRLGITWLIVATEG